MKKGYFKFFLIMLMLMCSTLTALAVDYALGGYLNGQDVNNYDGNWKFTKSGSNYVLTKTFSKTDNYFWIFDGKALRAFQREKPKGAKIPCTAARRQA